jgi:uncharacterized protein
MTRLLVLLFALITLRLAAADISGHWEGQIDLSSTQQLAIRVDLERRDNAWTGTIDIPVQGLRGFKLDPVTFAAPAVKFAMPNIPGDPTFAGKLDQDAGRISGDFTQGSVNATFKLERKAKPAPGPGEVPAKGIPGEGLAGHWVGALKATPVIELRLALEVTKSATGTFEATIFSLDQGGAAIPVTELTDTAGAITMKIPKIGGTYEGKMSADGSEFVGEWQQAGPKLPLTFKRVAQAATLKRPQDPKKPYPYTEETVTVPNDEAGIKLAGTFTVPPGPGPHPAVVLITGSGPQDRDESLMGHRPFLVLADHLTRAGIAVLRCDDRGVGQSTGNFGEAVTDDFVSDALSGVAWLRTRKDVDPHRIGLVGHSEGGVVAPLAAAKKPDDVAFIVLLAGVGVPMEQLLLRQSADLSKALGMSEERVKEGAEIQKELLSLVKNTTDGAEIEKQASEILKKRLAEYTDEQRKALGLSESMLTGQIKMVSSPWFRKLLAYDPAPALRQVKCPVLAINGEKDLQVAAKENLDGIRVALTAGGNTRVKIVELPGLNHLFQTCTTGAFAEYGQIEETFAPAALEAVSAWIREQAAK